MSGDGPRARDRDQPVAAWGKAHLIFLRLVQHLLDALEVRQVLLTSELLGLGVRHRGAKVTTVVKRVKLGGTNPVSVRLSQRQPRPFQVYQVQK